MASGALSVEDQHFLAVTDFNNCLGNRLSSMSGVHGEGLHGPRQKSQYSADDDDDERFQVGSGPGDPSD